jgi:hypothetical protein
MRRTVDKIMSSLGLFALQPHGRKDFSEARERLTKACSLSHVRVLSAPLVIEGSDRSSGSMSWWTCNVTGGTVEVTECIAQPPPTTATPVVHDNVGQTKETSKSKAKKSSKKRVQIDPGLSAATDESNCSFTYTEVCVPVLQS